MRPSRKACATLAPGTGCIETLAYDKAADDGKVHALLNEHGITPVIELRSHWHNQREKLVPGQERPGNIVDTEVGTVLCINTRGRPGQPLDPGHNATASLHPARLAIPADHIPARTVSPGAPKSPRASTNSTNPWPNQPTAPTTQPAH